MYMSVQNRSVNENHERNRTFGSEAKPPGLLRLFSVWKKQSQQ